MPALPLECFHGNGYSESVEVVRSVGGMIVGLHLKILMDGEWYICCLLKYSGCIMQLVERVQFSSRGGR